MKSNVENNVKKKTDHFLWEWVENYIQEVDRKNIIIFVPSCN